MIGKTQLRKSALAVRLGRQLDHVNIVPDVGLIRSDFDLPLFTRPVMPACRAAHGVGDFRLQVDVAHIIVAVAKPVDHPAGHPIGGPCVALVEVGGAGLARVANLESTVARSARSAPSAVRSKSMSVRERLRELNASASMAYMSEYPLTGPVFVQTVSLRMPSSVVHFEFHLLATSANHASLER